MIPLVDISVYAGDVEQSDTTAEEIQTVAENLRDAFSSVGFVYLKNHGISESKITEFFEVSKRFFEQSVSDKKPFVVPDNDYYGWMRLETERLNPNSPQADLKESYNFHPRIGERVTPTNVPNFSNVYNDFFKLCQDLTYRVLDLTCIGLNLDREFFRQCHENIGKKENLTCLRSLYYPPVTSDVKPGQFRCGEHTDYGTVTLLFQDNVGGLQVKPVGSNSSPSEVDFISADSIPGTILVNLGALMQRWTADKLIATEHRVVIPEAEIIRQKSRQSAAFFVQPDNHVIIKCLDESDKYEPMTTLDYLNMRFHESY